uniref:Uncharacterized protein n=1 Tax=Daphnia magna TaxID=35525 RepID=A0A0P6GZB8_9CRUS
MVKECRSFCLLGYYPFLFPSKVIIISRRRAINSNDMLTPRQRDGSQMETLARCARAKIFSPQSYTY